MQRMNIRIANISYLFLTLPCRRICLPRSWSYSGTKWRNILEQRRHGDSSVTGAVKLLKIVKQCHCQDAAGQCKLHMQCNAWDTRELGDPRFPKETTWREILSLDSSLQGKKNKSRTSTTCAILQTEKKWGNLGKGNTEFAACQDVASWSPDCHNNAHHCHDLNVCCQFQDVDILTRSDVNGPEKM